MLATTDLLAHNVGKRSGWWLSGVSLLCVCPCGPSCQRQLHLRKVLSVGEGEGRKGTYGSYEGVAEKATSPKG